MNFATLVFEPVLSGAFFGRLAEIPDHFINVVLQGNDFTRCLNGDGARKIPFRYRGCDFRNSADLRCEIRSEMVHIIRKVAPCSGRTGNTPGRPISLPHRLRAPQW